MNSGLDADTIVCARCGIMVTSKDSRCGGCHASLTSEASRTSHWRFKQKDDGPLAKHLVTAAFSAVGGLLLGLVGVFYYAIPLLRRMMSFLSQTNVVLADTTGAMMTRFLVFFALGFAVSFFLLRHHTRKHGR